MLKKIRTKCSHKYTTQYFILLISLICISSKLNAQIQNLFVNSYDNIVKINFSTAPPTVSYTGINHGFEAIAHAEDGLGNILFFVNSDGVYTAKGALMPGSKNIYANSSTSEIDICPFPNNPNKFYVFYNSELCSSLYYSIVDMKLDDGHGDVISLNTLLDSADVSEGLEIVKRPCRNSYWLIAYACESGFKKYLIDEKGVSAGTLMYPYSSPPLFLGRGELDYNNGKMGISFANNPTPTAFICDFDAYNGVISNPKTIVLPEGGNGVYGMEFSPDGSKAYMTEWYKNKSDNLYQYDFETEKLSAYFITSTAAEKTTEVTGPGQIELGTDGKLYIPFDGGNQITVINNPNSIAPTFSKITTTSKLALGISDHIQSEMYKTKNNFTYTHVCLGETTNFNAQYAICSNHAPKLQWDFGDNTSKKNTSDNLNPSHHYSNVGTYKVNLYITDSIGTDTISHTITIATYPKVNLGKDLSICKNQPIVLDANNAGMSYIWSTREYQQKINVASAGKYWVNVINKSCSSSDTILIKELPLPNVDLGNDRAVCDGSELILNPKTYALSYSWSTGENTPDIKITSTGSYWVTVSDGLCTNTDTVDIIFTPAPIVNLGKDTILCGIDFIMLDAGNNGAEYSWSTDETSQSIKANKTGMYYVAVNNGICIVSDTLNIIIRNSIPTITVPEKFDLTDSLSNSCFKISAQNINEYHIKIVNSINEMVYESSDSNQCWNGKTIDLKIAEAGVYYYTIEYNTLCKINTEVKKGVFSLVR